MAGQAFGEPDRDPAAQGRWGGLAVVAGLAGLFGCAWVLVTAALIAAQPGSERSFMTPGPLVSFTLGLSLWIGGVVTGLALGITARGTRLGKIGVALSGVLLFALVAILIVGVSLRKGP